ncbi:AMP-binding protein [Chelatococcus reniformis]|uniref:Acid--CoA ligase n=1 Tax=Chelatococcus reniformis TaxID=1494448 RepID=A0A916UXQ2_9HYPH|nr:AMP-binding protein [Chelatococcus reniformis]GGC91914.1 acid--CoA ligase [Chelatococcus reniformis]
MARCTYDWIRHHRQIIPGKLALIDLHSSRSYTYAALDERIDALTRFLEQRFTIARDDTVAVLCHNSTDVLEVQFACRRLPARFLPLNWRLTAAELEYIMRDAGVSVLFVGPEFEAVGREAAHAAGVPHVLTVRDGADSDYEQGIARHRAGAPRAIPELSEETVWTVMYTSGTTGHPKGALITYGMVDCLVAHLVAKVGLSTDTVSLTVLPMFHISGLNTYVNPVLCLGGTNFVMRTFDASQCLRLIADPEAGLSHFMGVPTHFLFMSELPQFQAARFDHLVSVISGGQAVPIPMVDLFASKGMRLQQGWGMTEACSLILLLSKHDIETKRGSVGLPVMNVDIRIVDAQFNDVTPGEVGELLVRGPQISPGYLNNPAANASQWHEGWFRTGDAFRIDEDGYYYIVDRWKDMYISGGENVYPAEVERVIVELDQVLEVAVVGIPNDRWGEVGRAFIALRNGAPEIGPGAVIDHCRTKLARYKVPAEVVFVRDLPHTPSGKIQKHVLPRTPLAPAPAGQSVEFS